MRYPMKSWKMLAAGAAIAIATMFAIAIPAQAAEKPLGHHLQRALS